MRIELPIREARLVRRYKRFLADVELADGETLTVHCPNPGAMLGVAPPGARVVLRDSRNPARKLRYTLQAIEVGGTWVGVDTSLANPLVAEAIGAGRVPELAGYESVRREVSWSPRCRLDLLLEGPSGRCWVEVKTTTLAEGGLARFPDSVTARGRRHVEELERLAAAGERAVIFFSVARADVEAFRTADDIDPEYGRALSRARAAGVEVLAYATRVRPRRLELGERLRVEAGAVAAARARNPRR